MSDDVKEIPLEWYVPDDMVSLYANNIVVQHTDAEFVISFFATLPPLVVGNPDEVKRQVDAIDAIRARCVARIIVAPAKMESFIGALVQNFTRFSAHKPDEPHATLTRENGGN